MSNFLSIAHLLQVLYRNEPLFQTANEICPSQLFFMLPWLLLLPQLLPSLLLLFLLQYYFYCCYYYHGTITTTDAVAAATTPILNVKRAPIQLLEVQREGILIRSCCSLLAPKMLPAVTLNRTIPPPFLFLYYSFIIYHKLT